LSLQAVSPAKASTPKREISPQRETLASVYFLLKASGEAVTNDFFITRVWLPGQRTRTLVVFLQNVTWEEIDGETLQALLSDLETVLPHPARVSYHSGELVVADYDDWKWKMQNYQKRSGELA
jgi:hypothetical protein